MAFQFTKATKKQAKARIAIAGPAGCGKSYTALLLASLMCKRIAAIDTEHGSLSKYSDQFNFDVLELEDFHPNSYIAAIKAAETAGYDGLIIDSASHEWNGHGGCLELVDQFARKNKGGNNFAAWGDVTPLHNAFIEAIHAAKMHLFTTFRSKMDYLQTTNSQGRTVIQKVGMAPITREGAEYEHDVVGEMDLDHNMVITKSRCKVLADKVINKPGSELAKTLTAWLSDGANDESPSAPSVPAATFKPNNANGHTVDILTGEVLPPPTDGHSNDRPVCVDCHQPIGDVTIKGRLYTAAELVKLAVKAFGVPACQPCGAKRKAGAVNGK